MAKHRVSENTPEEHTARSIIRRVIQSYEFQQHSKQDQWRQNMMYALATHLENAHSPSHRNWPSNMDYKHTVRFLVLKNNTPTGWDTDTWHSYMYTLAGHEI